MKKYIYLHICFLFFVTTSNAQQTFIEDQKKISPKVIPIFKKMEDTLKKQFIAKKINWPPQQIYLRSFKYDKSFEVWIRNDNKLPFELFKKYKVCMQSGTFGPKRMEGDFQVPEGFYSINNYKTVSNYHLALGVNYPNCSDRILADKYSPGGEIFVHGNCVSVGCLPLTDPLMEEVYYLSSVARSNGQDFVPIHIFPLDYDNKKSMEYFANATLNNQPYQKFALNIKQAYDHFNKKKTLPIILVNEKGEYLFY